MQKRILISLAVTGGLALTGAAAAPALASAKSGSSHHHEHDSFRAGGTVSAVDGTALTITVTGRKSTTTTTYAVSSTAKIEVDRKVTALSDLSIGLPVRISGTVADSTKTVTGIVGWTTVPTSASPSSTGSSHSKSRHHHHKTSTSKPTTTPTASPTA